MKDDLRSRMEGNYLKMAERIVEKLEDTEPGTDDYKRLQSNLKTIQEMADSNARTDVMVKRARKWPELAVKVGLGVLSIGGILLMYRIERDPDHGAIVQTKFTSPMMRTGGL